VFCPCCGSRAHTMTLETGPQLVRHDRQWSEGGERRTCRQTWIAVPNEQSGTVLLKPVSGRKEIDETLKGAAEAWLEEHRRSHAAAFEAVFLVPDKS
jgi:hypothetical protein